MNTTPHTHDNHRIISADEFARLLTERHGLTQAEARKVLTAYRHASVVKIDSFDVVFPRQE